MPFTENVNEKKKKVMKSAPCSKIQYAIPEVNTVMAEILP